MSGHDYRFDYGLCPFAWQHQRCDAANCGKFQNSPAVRPTLVHVVPPVRQNLHTNSCISGASWADKSSPAKLVAIWQQS
jgi:hypothetical protein